MPYSDLETHVAKVVALANGSVKYHTAPAQKPSDPTVQPVDIFGSSRLLGSPPCPVGLLPEIIEIWAADVAERLGVDEAMVAMPMLAVCAAAIDDRVQIQPLQFDTSWRESARLWVAFVADSGEKKSAALKAAVHPLSAIEKEWFVADKEKTLLYHHKAAIFAEAQKITQKAQAKSLAKGFTPEEDDIPEPPAKPPNRRKIIENSTIEALADVLSENPWGLLEVHDELSGWFGSFDAYRKAGVSMDRALYLELYNGGSKVIDRASKGRTYVPNWSLSLVGGIQPEPMRRLAGKITDDGLIQRFMVVFAQRGGPTVDKPANLAARAAYEQLIRTLVLWDIGGPEEVRICRLSPEAQPYRELLNKRIQQVRAMAWVSPAFHSHLAKWEGLFPRLCLLFHVIDHAQHLAALPDEVDEVTAQRVLSFMLDYLLPHACRFYTELLQQEEMDSHTQWIAGYILAHKEEIVSTRTIGRVYRPLRGKVKEIQQAMEHLTALSWVNPINDAIPGGARRWKVNPEVHIRFASRAEEETRRRAAVIAQIQEAVRDFPALQGRNDETSHSSLEEEL